MPSCPEPGHRRFGRRQIVPDREHRGLQALTSPERLAPPSLLTSRPAMSLVALSQQPGSRCTSRCGVAILCDAAPTFDDNFGTGSPTLEGRSVHPLPNFKVGPVNHRVHASRGPLALNRTAPTPLYRHPMDRVALLGTHRGLTTAVALAHLRSEVSCAGGRCGSRGEANCAVLTQRGRLSGIEIFFGGLLVVEGAN